ncbi:MAG TPA: SDR family oxidoreductase [Dehalococcoidia bacterium]|nr:SDR family oxidoreductase [Dehalococcoidia bacterium]
MKVLVTGHNGYIGNVLVPMFKDAGHEVVGLDSYLFRDCRMYRQEVDVPSMAVDVRDVAESDLAGFDAIVHLAALSNDPLGDLDPDLTYDINYHGSVRLATLARSAGVGRFLFSSSCSLYGASSDEFLTEEAGFNPVTPYGASKIKAEDDIRKLADASFSPTYLRNATAYGISDHLRGDLVVNNLTGYAFLTGEALLKSDGKSWRPLVHIEDISRAFLAVLEAPREKVHNEAFNVGATKENYLISDVAKIVGEVTGAKVTFSETSSPDARNYRVNCDKIARRLPASQPRWTVRDGVEEIYGAYRRYGLSITDFLGPRYQRIKKVRQLMETGQLDHSLRWRSRTFETVAV